MVIGNILGQKPGVQTINGQRADVNGNFNITPDDIDALPKSGGTMSGAINMSQNRVTNVAFPSDSKDVATKGYADDKATETEQYVDSKATQGQNYTNSKFGEANNYTDRKLGEAESYTDTQLQRANDYTDNKVYSANSYTDSQVSQSRSYTDSQVSGAKAYTRSVVNNAWRTATGILSRGGWSENWQSISCPGLISSSRVIASANGNDTAGTRAWQESDVWAAQQVPGAVRFYHYGDVPTSDIPVIIFYEVGA